MSAAAPPGREIEETHLISVLRELHADDPEFGYRFLADELHQLGYRVSERRVWRLCQVAGIRSVITKWRGRYRKALPPVRDYLVQPDFTASVPNECWLIAVTEHTTAREDKLYLYAVKDVWSNRVVGYAIDDRMKASLAVRALENAVMQCGNPVNVVGHSSRGFQFGSKKFRRVLMRHNLLGSMGRVGATGDNAVMESFFSLLQKNVRDRQYWTLRLERRLAIVAWIEGNCHRKRRQRGPGRPTLVEFEAVMVDAVRLAA